MPGSLSAAIADRLGFVTGPVREILRVAALLGVDFAVTDLAIILDRSVADLVRAIDEARAAGVLAESGNGLGFRHPLIRAALYDEMPAPVRAAWHRDAGRALAEAGAPADRVARQMLRAVAGPGGTTEPMDEWMLDWLADARTSWSARRPRWRPSSSAGPSRAPRPARRSMSGWPAGWPTPSTGSVTGRRPSRWPTARWSTPLSPISSWTCTGRWPSAACWKANPPSLSRRWTGRWLRPGSPPGTAPGCSRSPRGRTCNLGEAEKAGQVATRALAVASEAGDNWAMGWALHVMALVTSIRGRMTDALPLFDRALDVTQADPALADLRLLLQINKAITLGCLDRYEEALTEAGQARDLADQVGTTIRLAQAHGALAQLFFQTGRWDDALAEVGILPEDLKEPAAACCELGIAAVISFHRGETGAARRHLDAAAPHAKRIGHRLVGPLALARSLDREHDGALSEALAALAEVFSDGDDRP